MSNVSSLSFLSDVNSSSGNSDNVQPWEKHGGFIVYFVLMCYIFIGFEVICDAFFVPALNLLCEKFHISKDFAGATLMGIGGNLPDIFSGIIGVCVLKTDVGPGSIVGSMLFNHLCIVGFTVLVVGEITLSFKSVIREVSFYTLTVVAFLLVLMKGRIEVWDSIIFLVIYAIYVTVCWFTPKIVICINSILKKKSSKKRGTENRSLISSESDDVVDYISDDASTTADFEEFKEIGSLDDDDDNDIISDISDDDGYTPPVTSPTGSNSSSSDDYYQHMREQEDEQEARMMAARQSPEERKKENKEKLVLSYSKVFANMVEESEEKGEEVGSGAQLGLGYGKVQMHGFLYKKSRWYSTMSISSRVWQKRWFVLGETFWYCRNPLFLEKRKEIPLWKAWKITQSKEDPCAIHIYTKKQTYILRAEEEENASRWVRELKARVKTVKRLHPELYASGGLIDVEDDDDEESLLEFPYDAPFGHVLMWILSLPFAVLFTFTIPDIKKERLQKFLPLTFFMVVVWLGITSYAMVWGAKNFARCLHIPDDIMGISITAIGASLPSLFSSVIAAKQGEGNMAISNAFGSNLTALLALGLPCFVYSSMMHPGKPYEPASSVIFITVAGLILSILAFVIIVFVWKLHLKRAHGGFFIFLYAVFLSVIITFRVEHIELITVKTD